MKEPESRNWVWLRLDVVLAIHDEQISEHGGLPGIRDIALLESALARPRNLAVYGAPDTATPDAAMLAAAYAYGLARNHPFADGNKRMAYLTALVFLLANGYEFTASDAESVRVMMMLAAGQIEEAALGDWFRGNMLEAL